MKNGAVPTHEGCHSPLDRRFETVAEQTTPTLADVTRQVWNDLENMADSRDATKTILDEARDAVYGPRQAVYDHPLDNFGRIAKMWSVILGVEVTEEQHVLCMLAVKIARLMHTPDHRDTVIDIAGYAATIERVQEERRRRASPA